MKRLCLFYCGLICALMAMADDNSATLWVGESHTFSVPIEPTTILGNFGGYWKNMRWEYESETDNAYFTIDSSETSSGSEYSGQAKATVSLSNYFSGTKHVVFRYTQVTQLAFSLITSNGSKTFDIECNQAGITITPSSIDLQVGDKQNLQWTLSPTPPAGIPGAAVLFSSSNNEIAMVDVNGCVTGKSIGQATITAETNYATSASCVINVTPIWSSSISIDPSSATLLTGSTIQLHAVLPENASANSVTWASSNVNVATVNANGMVSAVNKGNTTITATLTDGSNTCALCSIRVLQGDVNGDGVVDVSDVILIIDMVLGTITFD